MSRMLTVLGFMVVTVTAHAETLTLPGSEEEALAVTEVEAMWVADERVELEIGFNKQPTDLGAVDIGFSEDGKTEPQWYRLEELASTVQPHPVDSDVIEATITVPQDNATGVYVRDGEGEAIYTPIEGSRPSESAGFRRTSQATIQAAACQPQCTTWVVQRTGINFKKCWGKQYGNAGEWVKYAKKCGFKTSSTPKKGAIGEIKSPGHVFHVTSVKEKSKNKYELVFTDANWNLNCGIRTSVKAEYNKSTDKITMGGNTKYSTTGFITKW